MTNKLLGEVHIVHQGKYAETKFGDFELPPFPQTEHMCVDMFNSNNRLQPLRYKQGDTLWQGNVAGGEFDKPVFTMVFQFFGKPEHVANAKAVVAKWAAEWVGKLQAANIHLSQRYLYSDNPIYAPGGEEAQPHPGVLRTLVIRLYNNADFQCTEHPEFLVGEPMGMYHCPVCNHMQMAGMPHITEE